MMQAALIGLGMVSRTYGEAIRNSQKVSLKSVYATNKDSREDFTIDFVDVCDTYAECLAEIAEDPEIDFVILATPPNARIEIVQLMAEAGKPILMEKPVERTLKSATAVVDYCEAKDVPLGIMLQHRARPIVGQLIEKLGDLGDLLAAEISVPWWRPQSYYNENGRGTYIRDGGGVMIAQAIHTLDLMLALTGPVLEVTAMCATTGFHDMEAEDFVSAGLKFENGAVGTVLATTASFPGRGETITLHCKNGSAHLASGVLQISWQDGRIETFGQEATSGSGADPMAFTSDWHQTVIEDFAEALAQNREPLIPGRSALDVHKLISAIEESGRDGERVYLKEFP
ncbi:MAG: Gfo/Idh/MocA family oxidoreductase [Silicimonas sp.]|nr:Gfo/Idh/MocA family oxidoreductase [Silicimonas sp.]